MSAYGLGAYDAAVLASERPTADYFEAVCREGADPKPAANWIINETGAAPEPAALAALIHLVADGTVSHQAAKRIYSELAGGGAPREVAERLGLIQVRDEDALRRWVDEVIAAHPEVVARYRAGEIRLMAFLTGQVMKQSRGKADPKGVQLMLARQLEGS
jgi:aspartyl-tRNA(Asn)/glutamyl-tRNA(Gln) amidotransferase subunit B